MIIYIMQQINKEIENSVKCMYLRHTKILPLILYIIM